MPEIPSSRPMALLVTRNFPPLLGGMEKVNQHLLEALQPSWRIALCGPSGCSEFAPPNTEVRQVRAKPLPLFLASTLSSTLLLGWKCRPAWVIAGSGLTAPIAWLAARCAGGKAAVYLHGLDIVVPSRLYQWLWLPFIRRCDLALVNSANTGRLAEQRGVRPDRLQVLHPGTDLPVLNPTAALDFRKQHNLGCRPLLLSAGRLTQRKGLAEFVARTFPAIVAHDPSVLLLVIGDEASDALRTRSGSERERILAAARQSGVDQNLRFFGRCNEVTLSAAYQAADLHIFPVLELPGDVEGFGMVALEAAAHGLPTVAFDVGGVADAVQDGKTGTLVNSGDYDGLRVAVLKHMGQSGNEAMALTCRAFAAGKAWPVFGERLRTLLGQAGD
jgi:phosphatidylinositol alpha-1,6-mannosyltransferase